MKKDEFINEDEFINKMVNKFHSPNEECPSEFGLKNVEITKCCPNFCPECWKQAKKQLVESIIVKRRLSR